MTNMLTDTDLIVIENLDFEPECEWYRCDVEADYSFHVHAIKCGCPASLLLCDAHMERNRQGLSEQGAWHCSVCGQALGCGVVSDFYAVDRIEPLR